MARYARAMTFREVLDFARQWHGFLDGGDTMVVLTNKSTGARVVVEGKTCALVLKALVAGATRGCKAIQGSAAARARAGPTRP